MYAGGVTVKEEMLTYLRSCFCTQIGIEPFADAGNSFQSLLDEQAGGRAAGGRAAALSPSTFSCPRQIHLYLHATLNPKSKP